MTELYKNTQLWWKQFDYQEFDCFGTIGNILYSEKKINNTYLGILKNQI